MKNQGLIKKIFLITFLLCSVASLNIFAQEDDDFFSSSDSEPVAEEAPMPAGKMNKEVVSEESEMIMPSDDEVMMD